MKAVQTQADAKDSRFKDWFEALQYMKDEIDKCDYDIALIGCGAYGMCLAAHVKRQGKQAVHLASMTQMLLGYMESVGLIQNQSTENILISIGFVLIKKRNHKGRIKSREVVIGKLDCILL